MITVSFSGQLGPNVLREIRLTIFRFTALNLLAKFGLIVIAAIAFFLLRSGWRLEEEVVFAAGTLVVFVVLAARACFSTGKWWRALQAAFPFGLSGHASPTQLVITGLPGAAPWSSLTRVVTRGGLVLLFFGPHSTVPLHRSLFSGEAEWRQFLSWATPGAA